MIAWCIVNTVNEATKVVLEFYYLSPMGIAANSYDSNGGFAMTNMEVIRRDADPGFDPGFYGWWKTYRIIPIP